MMDMPETIWAKTQEWPKGSGRIVVYATAQPDPDEHRAAYRRADLPPRVKPLVWVKSGGSHVMDHECHTVPTAYTVRYSDENGWKWSAMGIGSYGWAYTPEAAKAAAQADYTARILAALEGEA